MKKILLPLLCVLFFLCDQTIAQNLKIYPIAGFKIHTNQLEEFSSAGFPKIFTSPVLGLELSYKNFPLSVGYQRDFNIIFWNYIGQEYDEEWNVLETLQEDQIQLCWKFKHFSIGLGHYWKKRENELNYWIPGAFQLKRKGIQFSFSYPTQWLDIELRTRLQYDPDFSALVGGANYSLLFLYRIGKNKPENLTPGFLTVNGILGIRAFPLNIKLLPGEEFNMGVGFAPALGLEFLINNINTSLNFEKDWWLYFNGGSPERDLRGLIYNTFIGIKYHYKLRNEHHLRFGLGGSWIEDNENKFENITPNPTPAQQKLGNFQVKGLGVSFSYEILRNTDIELKTTIPFIGERPFENPSRNSIGIFYRHNPFKKK